MTDLIWYARLAVAAGALVLLSQAITGQSPSFITFLGVLCLTVGFAAFLSGLALDGRFSSSDSAPQGSQDKESALPEEETPIGGPSKP